MWIVTSGTWLRGLVGFDFFVCFAIDQPPIAYLPAASHIAESPG
jgi:hypothetical protein